MTSTGVLIMWKPKTFERDFLEKNNRYYLEMSIMIFLIVKTSLEYFL